MHVCSNFKFTQALLATAAGTEALTVGCLSLKNAQEDQPLDIALQNRQWHATQLLVAAGLFQLQASLLRFQRFCPFNLVNALGLL